MANALHRVADALDQLVQLLGELNRLPDGRSAIEFNHSRCQPHAKSCIALLLEAKGSFPRYWLREKPDGPSEFESLLTGLRDIDASLGQTLFDWKGKIPFIRDLKTANDVQRRSVKKANNAQGLVRTLRGKVRDTADAMPDEEMGPSGNVSGAKRRYYVFCRIWSGFGPQFPFDRFNNLPDEKIASAVYQAVKLEFAARPQAEAEWRKRLEDDARAKLLKQLEHWKPVTYGGGRVTAGPRHPKHGELIHPRPKLEPIPALESEKGFGYALAALGWGWTWQSVSMRTVLKRHLIIAADVEQDAADVVKVLNQKSGRQANGAKFDYFPADSLDRAGRLACEQEIDQVGQTNARIHVFGPTFAQLVRCAQDLLNRMAVERQPAATGKHSEPVSPDSHEGIDSSPDVLRKPNAARPTVTEGKSEADTEHVDDKGNVTNPKDPSAYTSASQIIKEDSAIAFDIRELHRILKMNPWIRRWKPGKQRLKIHLGDWTKYKVQNSGGIEDDPAVIEQRKAEVKRRKLPRK